MTKEDLIIEKLERLEVLLERIIGKSITSDRTRSFEAGAFKRVLEEIADHSQESAKYNKKTAHNTRAINDICARTVAIECRQVEMEGFLNEIEGFLSEMRNQLEDMSPLLQDKFNVDSDSKEVAQ
jgi:hypothetical protein